MKGTMFIIALLIMVEAADMTQHKYDKAVLTRCEKIKKDVSDLLSVYNQYPANRNSETASVDSHLEKIRRLAKRINDQHEPLQKDINNYLQSLTSDERYPIEQNLEDELRNFASYNNLFSTIANNNVNYDSLSYEMKAYVDNIQGVISKIESIIDLSAAPNGRNASNKGSGEWWFSTYDLPLLLIVLAIITGVAILIWMYFQMRQLEREVYDQNNRIITTKINSDKDIQALKQYIDSELQVAWNDNLEARKADREEYNTIIKQLRQDFRRQMPAAGHSTSSEIRSDPIITRPPEDEPIREAEKISANEYLTRAVGHGIPAKTVPLRPDILQPADGDGIYLMVSMDGKQGQFEVIPGVIRFSGAQDFSHFSHFYDCEHPSAGDVFILEPALAIYDEAARRWTRVRKGRLQTK